MRTIEIYENGDVVTRDKLRSMIENSGGGVHGQDSVNQALKRLESATYVSGLVHPGLKFCHELQFDEDEQLISFSICHDGYGCKYLTLNIEEEE